MATMPGLTESMIRLHCSADSFARGREYARDGAVLSIVRRGELLQADVEGSEPEPYLVRVALDGGGITRAECSCPYDWGGWCKHIVATLMVCLERPEAIEERAPLASVLADLDRDALQTLLLHVVERDPSLAEVIETQVALLQASASAKAAETSAAPRPRRTSIDTATIRRQVRSSLRSLGRLSGSEAYYQVGAVVAEVTQLVRQAWEFTRAGDGRTALAILEAVTDEYLTEWEILDDSDGEASGFFEDLGAAWTEAILTADLTRAERSAWARRLRQWDDAVADYGVDLAFEPAALAAEQGWDDPALLRVLRGEITEQGAWEEEAPNGADELAVARLNVLERQGRFEEYLHLAEAESQHERFATMLARLGRTEAAVEAGRQLLFTASEALHLAQTLREKGELAAALQVAEHGLALQAPRAYLAEWLCDVASAAGQPSLALRAALVALEERPTLAGYLRVRELAVGEWPRHREEILARLRKRRSYVPQAEVEIFLHEGLIDDAIAAVDQGATHTVVEQVVDAALFSHPDWAIKACRQQAEPIMDGGKAEYYAAAAQWLAKARTAYQAAGRTEEWGSYLEEQIARHQRKYKLRPMLEALRK